MFACFEKTCSSRLSHRNPPVRKSAAKYIYLVCEKLGPSKILNGGRDITERVLQVAAAFASDGPPEIRYASRCHYIQTSTMLLIQMVRQEDLSYAHAL